MTKARILPWLSWSLAAAICLGILPSFTALSETLSLTSTPLRSAAPLNFLKVAIPLSLIFLVLRRKEVTLKFILVIGALILFGSLSSLLAAKICGASTSSVMREWAAMVFGSLSAAAFVFLPKRPRTAVVIGWLALIYGLVFLDFALPAWIDWLYAHVFDPNTKWFDAEASKTRILTGVFGFQSMGKLLSWLPWIAFMFLPYCWRGRGKAAWLVCAGVSTGLILATTQRGPLLGMGFGWLAFTLHLYFRRNDRSAPFQLLTVVVISLLCTWLCTPGNILSARLESVSAVTNAAPLNPSNKEVALAHNNLNFRKIMWRLSLQKVKTHPLGDACIPDQEFTQLGIYNTHSHNIFLHQFRERGWLWGLTHFLLWLAAILLAWRSVRPMAPALFGGLICIIVQGMFDHPWFVMNHAMLLGCFLIASFSLDNERLFPAPEYERPVAST